MRPEHHEPGWSLRLTAKNPTSQRVIVAGSRIQSVGASEHGPQTTSVSALRHKRPFPDFSLTERDHLRPPHPAIVPPPSTTTVEPVENGVDAKYNTAFATSEDFPMRRIGNRSDTLANIASRSISAMPAHNGVAIIPGETAFTLIGASSRARPRASASSAALTASCRTVFADGRTLRKPESENPGRSF